MYLTFEQFKAFFRNAEINDEETFEQFEKVAETAAWRYIGRQMVKVKADVQYAIGLTIQSMYAMGIRPKDLPRSESEGGVNKQYAVITNIIPEPAQQILDNYTEVVI